MFHWTYVRERSCLLHVNIFTLFNISAVALVFVINFGPLDISHVCLSRSDALSIDRE